MHNTNSQHQRAQHSLPQTHTPVHVQIKLIQSESMYPFSLDQVTNFIQLSYTCLVDRKVAKQKLGIQVVGGYRKLRLSRRPNKSRQDNHKGKGDDINGNINVDRQYEHEQPARQVNSSQEREQEEDNFVVVLILVVDGLDNKEVNSTQQQLKNQLLNRACQHDQQMQQYFLGPNAGTLNRQDQDQDLDQNQKQNHTLKSINQSQGRNCLYVPMNIYKKLQDYHHQQFQLELSHIHSTSLLVQVQRFAISLGKDLEVQSFDEQAQKITITNLKLPEDEKQAGQLKDLITKLVVHPKYNQKSDKPKYYKGQFQFLIFPQTKNQKVLVDLSWLTQCQFFKYLKKQSAGLKNKLISMKRQNEKNGHSKIDAVGNSFRNYIEFGIQYKTKAKHNYQNRNRRVFIAKFVPGKTLIQFQPSINNPHYCTALQPFYRTINISSAYSQIYTEHQFYKNLKRKILQQVNSSKTDKFLCLRSDKSIGLSSFFNYLSQQVLNTRFVKIDCQSFVTQNEFFKRIRQVKQDGGCFILVKNIPWLQCLSKNQDIVQQTMKSLIQKIYKTIKLSYENTLDNFICALYFSQGQIPEQLPRDSKRWQLHIEKEQRVQILRKIFERQNKISIINQKVQQGITNMLVSSYGWTKIYKFMKSLGGDIYKLDEKQVIRLIQKEFSLQNVQNVAEVSWDDIGGLQTAKEEIIQTVLLPTKHPQIFDEWIRPRTGLLFYGPPGTGKTLLGKCIAKQCKMSFISVKGPQLLNMYVGESQKNVRQIFERAKQSKPCIVFMDELDALVPKRGNSSDSNSVMDRIVAQLLTQMDQASENQIFIIGATNRPDLLDPSILRAGRFDKQIYLGISSRKEDRVKILRAQTRNSRLEENFDFDSVIEKVPQNFTGADFYGLTSKAMMRAVQRSIEIFQQDQDSDPQVVITEQDFLDVVSTVKPSVSEAQLEHYQSLKNKFS